MQARPRQAIKLDQETRKVWIKNPAQISSFLINIFTYIQNAVSNGPLKPDSNEEVALKKCKANIMNMFGTDSDIAIKTATIGAYFRNQANAQLVEITAEDRTALLHILTS